MKRAKENSNKKFEQVLKLSGEELRQLCSAMNVGFCLHEIIYDKGKAADYRILYVNPACESIIGFRKEEVIGAKASEIYGTGKAPFLDVYAKVAETGDPTSFETYFSPMDKHFNISVFSPSKGKFATIFYETTEQKKAEKALKESEEKYRTLLEGIFEHTGTAMAIIEEDTTISMVNKEFEKLSGYTKEEIESKMSWTKFVHPEDLERMKGYHHARREGREAPTKYEFRFIDREDSVKNVFLSIEVIPGTKDTVCSIMDITYLKKLNKLLRATSEINELVAKERKPETLNAVCQKLSIVYEAAFTSLIRDGELKPMSYVGIEIDSVRKIIECCPTISKAREGYTCKHCAEKLNKYVLSIPLIHDSHHGIVTIISSSEFSDEEITLLEKLSSNIAFALSAYEIERSRKEAIEQLSNNLKQFDRSADRLRNPLAIIMSILELKDNYGDRALKIIQEQSERMKKELDELRREEAATHKLIKLSNESEFSKIR